MAKWLSILVLVLMVGLFPPSVLALISNNAVPGDATYPIKRKLEDGILLVVSLNPSTKAWFSANRSGRRFDEARVLIAQGKQEAGGSLNELVSQTVVAARQIEEVKNPVQKEQLRQQLTQSIEQYSQGLNQIQKQMQSEQPEVVSQTSPLPSAIAVNPSTQPVAADQAVKTPMPSKATQMLAPSPSPSPTANLPVSSDQLNNIQNQLKQIQQGLQEKKSQKTNKEDNNKKEDLGKPKEKSRNQSEDSKAKNSDGKGNEGNRGNKSNNR